WAWGRSGEGYWPRPSLAAAGDAELRAEHASLGAFRLFADGGPDGAAPALLFTENETNAQRLFAAPNPAPYVKDAFHEVVVHGRAEAANPACTGTKACVRYRLALPAGGEAVLRLRLVEEAARLAAPFGSGFDTVFERRRAEAD